MAADEKRAAAINLPIIVDGQVVGGLGVSGGTAEQDLQIAEAALAGIESGK